MFGKEALDLVLKDYDFKTVLDIGAGRGLHTEVFRSCGKEVTAIDLGRSVYFSKKPKNVSVVSVDFMELELMNAFDCIWACHVLEHQVNAGLFLLKIKNAVRENGVVAITVPPKKDQIVGGHVSIWNAGLLIYNLVLAGFDCRDIRIREYGYNISAVLKVKKITLPTLSNDSGDLNILKDYLPDGLSEGFNGNIKNLNW